MSASSSTFPSQFTLENEDVIMMDDPIQPSVPIVEITSTVPSKGKKIITEEDWKWLKRMVSHLYIDKDLTFVQIQTKLRIDHDFYLSRRTFTKKIDKWGLKKNLRKSERNELLKLGPKHEKFRGDHRLRNEAKLKRLQKRYGGDSTLLGHCNSPRPDDMEIDEEDETATATQSQPLPQNNPFDMENLDDQTQLSNDEVEEIIPRPSEIDTSTSNQWSEPTIINIEELAVALENLGLRGVRQLLTPYKNRADLEDSDSDTEPQQPLGPSRTGASDTELYLTQEQLVQHRTSLSNIENRKIRNLNFSPYSEISIFPARAKKASRMTWDTYVGKVNREWPMEIERLKSKLESPTLYNKERISTLDRLVSLENSMYLANYSTYEKLLTSLKNETICDRPRITKTYFHLIEEYIRHSQLQKAAKLFREYLKELESDEKNDFAKLELLYLQAYYLYNLGYYHKAENIIRQALWFALPQFGPYHDFTMELLRLYNRIAEQVGKENFTESENIYRFNISICSGEVADFKFPLWYDNATSLIWYLTRDRRYEEAQSLCTYLMKRAEQAFGIESLVYINCHIQQADIWREQGKVSESLDILYQLSDNDHVTGKEKCNIFDTIGCILWGMKDYSKAAIWYRKTFENRVIIYGLQHPYVLRDCEDLGDCFERLGRWNTALSLYSKFLERLRKCREVDKSSMEEVEGWILNVEETIEMIAQEKESERERERERESEGESEENENADGEANVERLEDMELEQAQDLIDSDVVSDADWNIDWDSLQDMPTPAFHVP